MKEYQILFNDNFVFSISFGTEVESAFKSISRIKDGKNSEVCSKLNGLYYLTKNKDIQSYGEICAGVGFSSALISHTNSPGIKMYLNDNNEHCIKELKKNVPNISLYYQRSYFDEELFKDLPPLHFLFFDDTFFTLNKKHLIPVLKNCLRKSGNVLVTDVFSFSLKPFNMEKYVAYLKRYEDLGCYAHRVYLYKNNNCGIIQLSLDKHSLKIIKEDEKTQIFSIKKLSEYPNLF